jgi:hypothetical protein
MPHLHWETDRQREKFAFKIEHFTESWKDDMKTEEEDKKWKSREERSSLPKAQSATPRPAQPRREKEISRSTTRPNALRQMTRTVSRR